VQQPPVGHRPLIIEASQSHGARHLTVDRTPLDGRSARRPDLYLTIYEACQESKDTSRVCP